MKPLIVLQGPTRYYEKIINCYKTYETVVWATWMDEPFEAKKAIEKSGIKLVLIEKPRFSGRGNVNFQCKSVYFGIKMTEHIFNSKYVIKVRSDITISSLNLFVSNIEKILKKHPMAFLGYHNHMGGYALDYIVAGSRKEMEKYWFPADSVFSGYPFAEMWLQQRFYKSWALSWKKFYQRKMSMMIPLDGITINSLKWSLNVSDYNDKQNYYMYDNYTLLQKI